MKPTKRNLFAIVCLLLISLPAAVPHLHGVGEHEAEICAGHLDHEGADDAAHAGSCSACRFSRRAEVGVPPVVEALPRPETPRLFAHHGEPCRNPIRPDGDCDRTRAPPAAAVEA